MAVDWRADSAAASSTSEGAPEGTTAASSPEVCRLDREGNFSVVVWLCRVQKNMGTRTTASSSCKAAPGESTASREAACACSTRAALCAVASRNLLSLEGKSGRGCRGGHSRRSGDRPG